MLESRVVYAQGSPCKLVQRAKGYKEPKFFAIENSVDTSGAIMREYEMELCKFISVLMGTICGLYC